MGVCYFLVREDNKELFDLDKGCWSWIFPLTPYYGYKSEYGYENKIERFKLSTIENLAERN